MINANPFNDVKEDIIAINGYFGRTPAKTPGATQLKNSWNQWYNNLMVVTESHRQEATNRRNAFNVANAGSPEAAQKVKDFLATADGRGIDGKTHVRPEVYKDVDSAGNFPKAKGITVASAAAGTVPKGARPTIRQGSRGEAVVQWQKIIGVTPDGNFGAGTHAATKQWQKDRGLTADGVVGSATWAAAIGKASGSELPFDVASVTPVAPATGSASNTPTGAVAQISTIKVPKPTQKPVTTKKDPEKIPTKVAVASATPATQSMNLATGIAFLDNLPTWAKVGLGGGVFALSTALAFRKNPTPVSRRRKR